LDLIPEGAEIVKKPVGALSNSPRIRTGSLFDIAHAFLQNFPGEPALWWDTVKSKNGKKTSREVGLLSSSIPRLGRMGARWWLGRDRGNRGEPFVCPCPGQRGPGLGRENQIQNPG
jgi:hypothetical protein